MGHNPETDQFYTKFFKVYVEGDEDRSLDPKSIIGNRCAVNAVICPDSIFVSDKHTTIQVKVIQVATMELDESDEEVIEAFVDEW